MSHTGFPPSLIILSLKILLNLKRGPETIQTLIHIRVNTLLIMVYAHCTDRRAMNAKSYVAASIVVCHYACMLHLSSFREHDFKKKKVERKRNTNTIAAYSELLTANGVAIQKPRVEL